MPEDVEGQEPVQESEVLGHEPPAPPEAEAPGVQVTTSNIAPKYVRYDQFRETNEEKNRIRSENEYLRQQLLQATSMAMQAAQSPRQAQTPPPPVDPELARIMEPFLAPLWNQNQNLARENQEIKADLASQKEWDRLVREVPDIEDLKDGIVEYLMSLPPNERALLSSSSATIRPIAEVIRSRRSADGRSTARTAQSDVRSRARSVTGASSPPPTNPTNTDWGSMDSETFFQTARKLGIDL